MDAVYELFKIKEESIKEKDIDLYMSTITTQDKLFYNEQKYWIKDMIKDEIKNVSFTVKEIKIIGSDYNVLVNQKHSLYEEELDFDYRLLLKEENGVLKDFGMNFNVIDMGNYKVKYMNDEATAKGFAEITKHALMDTYNLFGEKPDYVVELKLFTELDLVRQRSGPAYRWKYPLWAKVDQGIKIYAYMVEPQFYTGGIQHELIHILTIKGNKNNVMHWMAEGIAMKYGNDRYNTRHIDFSLKYLNEQNLSVPLYELMNMKLSNYTDMKDITRFYNLCFNYFNYLDTISTPKRIFSIFQYLTEHEPVSNEKELLNLTEKAFKKIIGLSLHELSDRYLSWYKVNKNNL